MKQVFRQVKYVIHPSFKHLAGYIMELPDLFASNKGKVIYKGRNELRVFDVNGQKIVVKSFCLPNVVNKIAYGLLRSSKAQRSYEYACLLQEKGIGTQIPAFFGVRVFKLNAGSLSVSSPSMPYIAAVAPDVITANETGLPSEGIVWNPVFSKDNSGRKSGTYSVGK